MSSPDFFFRPFMEQPNSNQQVSRTPIIDSAISGCSITFEESTVVMPLIDAARQLERELAALVKERDDNGFYKIVAECMEELDSIDCVPEHADPLEGIKTLRAALAERDKEIEKLRAKLQETELELMAATSERDGIRGMVKTWQKRAAQLAEQFLGVEWSDVNDFIPHIQSLRAQLAETQEKLKEAEVWGQELGEAKQAIDTMERFAAADKSQLLALQAHVEAQSRALRNLIFTATKCWDDAKPIKDGPGLTVTHPIIEEAKAALSSRPDLSLLEEVSEVLEGVRGFEVIGERHRKRIDSLLMRLNPSKL